MTSQEAFKKLAYILDQIKEVQEYIIHENDNLNIILLNLQIENARINQNTGIEPISKELNRVIDSIDDKVKGLMGNYKDEVVEILKVISEGLNKE